MAGWVFNPFTRKLDYDSGAKGDKGDTGAGVPVGGAAGQVLAKIDANNYNTHWVDQSGGTSIISVDTFADLPTAPYPAANTLYVVRNTSGAWYTFNKRNAGIYRSTGTAWEFLPGGLSLSQMVDTAVTSEPTDGELLTYESSSKLWKPKPFYISNIIHSSNYATLQDAIDTAWSKKAKLVLDGGVITLSSKVTNPGVWIDGMGIEKSILTGNLNDIWLDCPDGNVEYTNFSIYPSVAQSSNQIAMRFGKHPDTRTLVSSKLYNIAFWNRNDDTLYEDGHYIGVYADSSTIFAECCEFRFHEHSGIYIKNEADVDRGDHGIVNCFFSEPNKTSQAHIYVDRGSGIRVSNSKFISGVRGIYVNIPTGVTGTAESLLMVSNSSFENQLTNNINIINQGSTGPFYNVQLSGNEFYMIAGSKTNIDLSNCQTVQITGGCISGQAPGDTGATTGIGVKLRNVVDVTVCGVGFEELDKGVDYDSTVTNGTLGPNNQLNVATLYSGTSASVAQLFGGTGSPSSFTYLRGDGTWSVPSAGTGSPAGSVLGAIQLRNSDGSAFAADDAFYFDSTNRRIWLETDGTATTDIPSFVARNKAGNANIVNPNFAMQCYSSAPTSTPSFSVYRSRGTTGVRSPIQSGDDLGSFNFQGRGASTSVQPANIIATASENFTDSAYKAELKFKLNSGTQQATPLSLLWNGTTPTVKIPVNASLQINHATAQDGKVWTCADADGNGAWETLPSINAFSNIAVSGQSTVQADATSDTLTLAAGTGVSLTTDFATDTITISATAAGASGTAGAVQLSDGSGGLTSDASGLSFDATNNLLGVGSSPTYPLTVASQSVASGTSLRGASFTSPVTHTANNQIGSTVYIGGAISNPGLYTGCSNYQMYTYGTASGSHWLARTEYDSSGNPAAAGAGISLYHNRASNGLPGSGDRLGYVVFGSYDGTTTRNSAGIGVYAAENWTTSPSNASYMIFQTCPTGSATRMERLRITEDGRLRFSNQPAAPASATATGTAGDFYISGDYIYVCTATNTWKRAALATW